MDVYEYSDFSNHCFGFYASPTLCLGFTRPHRSFGVALPFEPMEQLLNDGQIFALRFAPDEELPKLVQRAVAEKMSGNQIKKAIVNWFPDHQRV